VITHERRVVNAATSALLAAPATQAATPR
jgi:hypothetical protein